MHTSVHTVIAGYADYRIGSAQVVGYGDLGWRMSPILIIGYRRAYQTRYGVASFPPGSYHVVYASVRTGKLLETSEVG
ncbi:hypothetical protein GFV31_25410 [Salmonella enterica]|nr:hypothetical protein [Salmonella enterica]EIG1227851.1 hypothetical protein [Salmonella enterica]EKK1226511.1 hypothetical protein [Salmonella enterica]